jgi:single-strand DNA-binding protein
MPSLNICHFIGNLTRDPEIRTTPSGKKSANFSLAINKRYNGQETTSYLDLTAWDTTADFAEKHLTKGRCIYAEAEARQDTWTDKNGITQRKTRFTVRTLQPLDSRPSIVNNQSPATAQLHKSGDGSIPNSQSSIVNSQSMDDIPF